MKKTLLIVLSVLCIGINAVMAQTKEETQVSRAVERFREALISGNRAELQAVAAEKLSYGHSSGKVEDKATFVEQIASGKSDFVTCDFSNQTISVSGNAAVVRHRLDAKTNDSGKPGSVSLNILLVFQKMNGKWLLLARQAVKVAV